MPIETILRAYIDETVDEEVIEETIEKTVTDKEKLELEKELSETNTNSENTNGISKSEDTIELEKPELEKNKPPQPEGLNEIVNKSLEDKKLEDKKLEDKKLEDKPLIPEIKIETPIEIAEPIKNEDIVNRLKFNDKDSVLDMGTNKSSEVSAPKTIERLEKISKEQNEKRKLEEEEDDYDDDYDNDKLTIHNNINLELDNLDVHNLDKKLKLETDPILDDIEVLG